MNNKRYIYFVEGENEKKLIEYLKEEKILIKAGKIRILNVFQKIVTAPILANITPHTNIVLVFDTDLKSPNFDIFEKNVKTLSQSKNVDEIILIPQCRNLEDEIVRSTTISKIREFFQPKMIINLKHNLISHL